ncbi:hypothetical protein [[Mycoplasma] collis]|uniref:hypothetical protein n=2 Tax=[Mycoplasma] collis TaxID=2127 RepID=UPI00051C8D2B|nr:hypothetical protein [[Mycoplasma] collis]
MNREKLLNKKISIWSNKKIIKIDTLTLMKLKTSKRSLQILISIFHLAKIFKQKQMFISDIKTIFMNNFFPSFFNDVNTEDWFPKSSFYQAIKNLEMMNFITVKNHKITINKFKKSKEFVILHKNEYEKNIYNFTPLKILFIHQAKILLLGVKTTKEKKDGCLCVRDKHYFKEDHFDCKIITKINKTNKFTFKAFKRLKISYCRIYYLTKNKLFNYILNRDFNIKISFIKSFDKLKKHIKTFHIVDFNKTLTV